ncbi:uncharacterized protein LOC129315141 isoform X2 [Prosopis cineraria]|uniref:uncharacterized protein LOC129315141 isoform X2 n=1 Tax=Prosopis cineraria TaxID=364024 RepID=UPI00240FB6CB|nr:uncharacterized protein LOC129315141 isoform X2 [Prosopis cineraria]
MEASDHPCDAAGENQSIATEPSSSSTSKGNNDSEANSDPIGNSSDVVAKGLSTMLSTIIRDFDYRARETFKSQDQLHFALDRLTQELDKLLEDAPLPFIMQHAAKISSVRKRVSSLNSLLKSIQGRIDNIDRMLFIGTTQEKPTI